MNNIIVLYYINKKVYAKEYAHLPISHIITNLLNQVNNNG